MTPSITARHLSRRTVFGAFLAMGACGPPAAGQRPSAVPGAEVGAPFSRRPDTVALARAIPDLMRVSDVPGLSVAVVQNGRVV